MAGSRARVLGRAWGGSVCTSLGKRSGGVGQGGGIYFWWIVVFLAFY